MSKLVVRDFARWIGAGFLFGMCVFAVRSAVSQMPPSEARKPEAIINGIQLTGELKLEPNGKISGAVFANNQSGRANGFSTTVIVKQFVFTGNPASRAFNPNDRQVFNLGSNSLQANLAAGQKGTYPFRLDTKRADKGDVSFVVSVLVEGKEKVIGTLRPNAMRLGS